MTETNSTLRAAGSALYETVGALSVSKRVTIVEAAVVSRLPSRPATKLTENFGPSFLTT